MRPPDASQRSARGVRLSGLAASEPAGTSMKAQQSGWIHRILWRPENPWNSPGGPVSSDNPEDFREVRLPTPPHRCGCLYLDALKGFQVPVDGPSPQLPELQPLHHSTGHHCPGDRVPNHQLPGWGIGLVQAQTAGHPPGMERRTLLPPLDSPRFPPSRRTAGSPAPHSPGPSRSAAEPRRSDGARSGALKQHRVAPDRLEKIICFQALGSPPREFVQAIPSVHRSSTPRR